MAKSLRTLAQKEINPFIAVGIASLGLALFFALDVTHQGVWDSIADSGQEALGKAQKGRLLAGVFSAVGVTNLVLSRLTAGARQARIPVSDCVLPWIANRLNPPSAPSVSKAAF